MLSKLIPLPFPLHRIILSLEALALSGTSPINSCLGNMKLFLSVS